MYPSVSVENKDFEGKKNYELSNHLGNVLAVISDRKKGMGSVGGNYAYFEAVTLTATDYFPFGMSMPGRSFNTEGYRYTFNGKEDDAEWAKQDYGARMYDKKTGRFLSIDPLIGKNTSLSPYSSFANNPIIFVDPDGRDNILYIVFIGDKKNPVLSKEAQDLIVARAQQVYKDNGFGNVKVIGLSASKPFSENERALLDATDRITYLGQQDIINSKDFSNDGANPGFTNPETHIGYVNTSSPFGNQMPIESKDDKALISKYSKDSKTVYPKSDYVFDAVGYLTWEAIHEGGGHGVVGSGHSDDASPSKRYSDIYTRVNGYFQALIDMYKYPRKKSHQEDNIMKSGPGVTLVRFPKEQNPGLFKFVQEDIDVLLKFYNTIKPKDNFLKRFEEYRKKETKK